MHLEKLVSYEKPQGPLLLVVADGVGLAESGPANALSLANTPIIDKLLASTHSTQLNAHGTHVGLPTDGDMGNSEVGHNTLGGGRIFDQGAKLVNAAFESGRIFESDAWEEIEKRGQAGRSIHFLGLLSDGNVHSHIDHLFKLIDRCQSSNIASVRVHILLDGRDVAPRSALGYVEQLENKLGSINQDNNFNYRIASGGGRMKITMDRYQADWAMVERGYRTHVCGDVSGIGQETDNVAIEIQRQYDSDNDLSDQYLSPFVVVDAQGPVGRIESGDGVVLFNFRGDRAIEISQALENEDFTEFQRGSEHTPHPEIFYCGMLQFDGDLNIPNHYLVNPPVIDRTMVEFMCAEKMKTFAVSETQKFGHVTYFWNGNKSGYIDESLETYIEIPSDDCEFNQAPEMKAEEISQATMALLNSGDYQFGRINFANGDMVGHTGDIPATVQSLECVDRCLGELLDCIEKNNGILIFTADHGNADEMFVEKDGQRIERTSHTLNPVPFVIFDSRSDNIYQLSQDIQGGLANVAATVFNLLGYRAPDDYCSSLITIAGEPNRKSLYKGRVIDLGIETVQMPNNEMYGMEVIRTPGGAVVAAVDSQGDYCLIKQFRHAIGKWIWEFPAGILEPNEDPDIAAKRELKEETGCDSDQWHSLGTTITTPGFCDEVLHIFLATDVNKGKACPDEHEFIEVSWFSPNQIQMMINQGEIEDAKSIVTFHKAQQFLNP